VTPHDSYSSSIGVLGCKVRRVAFLRIDMNQLANITPRSTRIASPTGPIPSTAITSASPSRTKTAPSISSASTSPKARTTSATMHGTTSTRATRPPTSPRLAALSR
jgi:hypothetical protein